MGYADLREYLAVLEKRGMVHRIEREVDKDWEIAAVARRAFQRISPDRRPALLFERVKGFTIPVLLGALGASRAIYAVALETTIEGIGATWTRGLNEPVSPRLVDYGACKEVVQVGEEVDLSHLPVPIWTVGEDPSPYVTAPCVCSKDLETGVRNAGTYRIQVKSRNTLGLGGFALGSSQHIARHIRQYERQGKVLPVAVVIGSDPTVGLVSVTKIPYGVDEFAVAGGLRGEPLDLVRCETVDLEVPASAEFVIEGEIVPGYREVEGPFGEYTGYMGAAGESVVIKVTALTHRKNPIYQAFFSQMPPSESSLIRGVGRELVILNHLRDILHLPVQDVHLPESGGSTAVLAISLRKEHEAQIKQTIWGAWAVTPTLGKTTIVVDDDVDIRDPFALQWAIAFRVQPGRDTFVVEHGPAVGLDPSLAPPDVSQSDRSRLFGSKLVIDATRKHQYPAAALPPKEHLRVVDEQWESYKLDKWST